MEKTILSQYGASSIQYTLMDNGKIAISNTTGSESINKNQELSNETMYGIGSVSKMYSTAAVMSLVDKGLVDIDRPLTDYIKDFEMNDERYKQITPRMLLNHSSGIYGTHFKNAIVFEDENTKNHDSLLNYLKDERLKYNPGETSQYCNDGFTLLEILVERVSGISFSEYFEKNFSDPLGLENTKTSQDLFNREKLAKFYIPSYENAFPIESTNIIGTGGFYSTTEDMSKFAQVLIGDREDILSEKSVLSMQQEEYLNGMWVEDNKDNLFGHGLGWDNVNVGYFQQYGIKALFKGGDTIQYHSALIVIPEYNLIAAVSSSGGSSLFNYSLAIELLENALLEKGIIDKVSDLKTFDMPIAKELTSEFDKYNGLYGTVGGESVSIDIKDNKLILPALLSGLVPEQGYIYVGDNIFKNIDGSISIKFVDSGDNTFIQSDIYINFPGLKPFSWKSYEFQKLDTNMLSKSVADVWSNRMNETYYLLDDAASSVQYFFTGSVAPMKINIDINAGYAYAGCKIVDENTAINVLKARDVVDLEFYEVDNIEYLKSRGYTFVGSKNIPNIWSGQNSKTTIKEDGFVRWYKAGDAHSKEILVDIPEKAGFVIYDENGACVHSSIVSGKNKAVIPANGLIGFIGLVNDVFNIKIN